MADDTGQSPEGAAALLPGAGSPGAEHPAGPPPATPPATPPTPPTPPDTPAALPWAEAADGAWMLGDQPWYATIPEDAVRATMEAKGYKNPHEAAMAYHNLLRLQNGNPNVVALPGEDATPEQIRAFHKALGAPETPDAYEFKFPEGQQVDENMLNFGRTLFHDLGLNPAQAQRAAEQWNEFAATQEAAIADTFRVENDEALRALEARHGDQYPAFLEAGKRVVAAAKLDAQTIQRAEAAMGTAGLVDLLCSIGSVSREDGFTGGGSGGGGPSDPSQMTSAQASAEIARLQADEAHLKVYNDENAPGHAEAVAKVQALYARV